MAIPHRFLCPRLRGRYVASQMKRKAAVLEHRKDRLEGSGNMVSFLYNVAKIVGSCAAGV